MADDWQAVAWEGVHLPLLAPTCLYEADAILIWFPYVTLPYPHYLDRRFNFISPRAVDRTFRAIAAYSIGCCKYVRNNISELWAAHVEITGAGQCA